MIYSRPAFCSSPSVASSVICCMGLQNIARRQLLLRLTVLCIKVAACVFGRDRELRPLTRRISSVLETALSSFQHVPICPAGLRLHQRRGRICFAQLGAGGRTHPATISAVRRLTPQFAARAGFDPATHRLTGGCSTGLS